MKKSNSKYYLLIFLFVLLHSFTSAQKKLIVIKVKNGQTYSFKEGKKILCKTYNENDSVFIKHHGTLTILSDSLIMIDNDTLILSDILSVKKYYSVGAKLTLSCLFLYIPVAYFITLPLAIGSYNWAISQGISEFAASVIGVGVEFTGAYTINYFIISNSPMFKAFNKVGTKYTLKIQD